MPEFRRRLTQQRVIAALTLRALVGRKRALLLAVPPVILVIVALALRGAGPGHPHLPAVVGTFGFSVVLPLTALIVGTSVAGAEIDDGSIVALLATPVRRRVVIGAKYTVAAAVTVVIAAVPELLAGVVAGPGSAPGLFAGAVAGAAVYNAVFLALSVLTTRAVAIGLAYILIWEGLLANLIGGARLLSVGQYSLGIAQAVAHDPALGARLGPVTAVIMSVLVAAVALAVATARLASFSLTGETA